MECLEPISIPRPNGLGDRDRVTVPCGKCVTCLQRRKNAWAFRIQQEWKNSISAFFLTLTYNDEYEKWNFRDPKTINGHLLKDAIKQDGFSMMKPVLCKRDLQLFLKKLRLWVSDQYRCEISHLTKLSIPDTEKRQKVSEIVSLAPKIRYFVTGEYGEKTDRPHYHMLLFNFPIRFGIENVEEIWSLGHIHIGTVNTKSIFYVAKYCLDNKSFNLCSKGIGRQYIVKMTEFHRKNNIVNGIMDHGQVIGLPRYYKNKIFPKHQQLKNSKKVQEEVDKIKQRIIDEKLKKGQNPYFDELMGKVQLTKSIKKTLKNSSKL